MHIDNQFKQNLFNSLKEDDQYRDLIQKLEDADHPNEISVNDQDLPYQTRDPQGP